MIFFFSYGCFDLLYWCSAKSLENDERKANTKFSVLLMGNDGSVLAIYSHVSSMDAKGFLFSN